MAIVKVIEVLAESDASWEEAVKKAVLEASRTVRRTRPDQLLANRLRAPTTESRRNIAKSGRSVFIFVGEFERSKAIISGGWALFFRASGDADRVLGGHLVAAGSDGSVPDLRRLVR